MYMVITTAMQLVLYHSNVVLEVVHAAGMDETYGTYVGDACSVIHD